MAVAEPKQRIDKRAQFREYRRTRSLELRNAIVTQNQGLVVMIAKRAQEKNPTNALEDLISVGNIGLLKAIEHFKPGRKVLFSTYSFYVIQNEILQFLRSEGRKNKPHAPLLDCGATARTDGGFEQIDLRDAREALEKRYNGQNRRIIKRLLKANSFTTACRREGLKDSNSMFARLRTSLSIRYKILTGTYGER